MRFKGMNGESSSDKQKEPDFPVPESPYTGKELGFDIRIFCAKCGRAISHSHYKLPLMKPCKCGNTTFSIRYKAEELVALGKAPKRLRAKESE